MEILKKRIGQICDADEDSIWREKYDIEMVMSLYELFLEGNE